MKTKSKQVKKKIKTYKLPRCPKTVTGKHGWKDQFNDDFLPVCRFCGLVDDREV